MGCETMPTKSSLDHGMQDREALQLVLENLSMIGLNSNLFEKDAHPNLTDDSNDQIQVERRRVSANITENIPVPSSEHVAEIVGKQGCKIKALRNKTNTYIKTPGRGDDPVFIITGRREDVDLAKAEILQASEHFSNIRAQRKGVAPPPIQPGQITKTIRVPYRVVGLVVGPKGQTIKQIQLKTQTYIVTPSRERDPVFEITGLPDSVEQARVEISNYIAARTGTFIDSEKKAIAPAVPVTNTWNGERCVSYSKEPVMPEEINEFLEEIFSGGPNNRSPMVKHDDRKRNSLDVLNSDGATQETNSSGINDQYAMWNHGFNGNLKSVLPINSSACSDIMQQGCVTNDPSSSGSSSAYSSFSFEASPLVRSSSYPVSVSGPEIVKGATDVIGRKTSDHQLTNGVDQTANLVSIQPQQLWVPPSFPAEASTSYAINPVSAHAIGSGALMNGVDHSGAVPGIIVDNSGGVIDAAAAALPMPVLGGPVPMLGGGPEDVIKNCIICKSNGISAALVPCGHNLFCYDCVSSLVQSNSSFCPVCHQPADHALRILQ